MSGILGDQNNPHWLREGVDVPIVFSILQSKTSLHFLPLFMQDYVYFLLSYVGVKFSTGQLLQMNEVNLMQHEYVIC